MEFKSLNNRQRTPEGFRLATFEEAKRKFRMLKKRGILDGSEILRLLDGVFYNGEEIKYKLDDSWLTMEMLVVGQSPTRISRNSSLLRKELYSKVNLSNERRKIALHLSCLFQDIEAIYWLLSEGGIKPELKEYFEKEIENDVREYFPDFLKILKLLFASVRITEGDVSHLLAYAVRDEGVLPENALAIAEIVLGECRKAGLLVEPIVDSQIKSVAKMIVDADPADEKCIGMLTKLLLECADPFKHKDDIIQPNFGRLLREATRRGYKKLTDALLGLLESFRDTLQEGDNEGRTPLHLAACGGDEKTVQVLLGYDSDPFKQDSVGKTALHHAVTNGNGKDTQKKIVEALLDHVKDNEQKARLLLISAAGIGTADQTEPIDADLRRSLEEKISETFKDVNVLKAAEKSGDIKLIWEFLNRGGDISSIVDKVAFNFTTKAIEKFSEQATDQPTLVDTLGRNVLAECISAHFLNPFIKSPITVSISGGSGSGKSSLLNQIEAYLLITAAQLAFPYLLNDENLSGAKKKALSSKGKQMCHEIEKGVCNLLESGNYKEFKDNVMPLSRPKRLQMSLVYLLKTYLPKHRAVYKSLACMDFNQLMAEEENNKVYESRGQSLGAVPRILTVNFNAGNYRGSTEAWAGLAVEITKEIEASMTRAQLLSTRWRNSWSRNKEEFYLHFIFPGILLTFVGAWIAWVAWKLIDRAHPSELKDLKYGSVTVTVIAIVWSMLGKVVSVFKPISTQMSGYFSLPDYSQQLGYQQKVVSDIKFLKDQIGKKPCFIFSFIAGEICNNWWGLWKENVEGTRIPQYGSAPEGKLRIIAFVDDLDQCEETVILPMLWAINLVFRVCEINVILTMDKATIQTAYRKSSLVQDRDFVDNFISKIVQLPVNIPDPTDEEWVNFLDTELLCNEDRDEEQLRNNDRDEGLPSNAQSRTDGGNGGEHEEVDGPKDIESGRRTIKWEGWCITFLIDWLKGIGPYFRSFIHAILYFLCFVVCNIRDETQTDQSGSKDDEQRLAVFSRDCNKILVDRRRQVRDTLMLSYNDEEADTFHELKNYATGIQKLPREWKCYMNYHKFARNVVSKIEKIIKKSYPDGWEVQFVVWTFVCSQWKHEMNVLIEDWYKYADDKDSKGKAKLKRSLKEIVAKYIKERMWDEQTRCQAKFTVEEQTEGQFGEQAGKQVFIVSNSIPSSSVGTVEKERERWENLQKCLENVHDVSLDCLRCFQHYRYHCDPRNLVSKLYKPKKYYRT